MEFEEYLPIVSSTRMKSFLISTSNESSSKLSNNKNITNETIIILETIKANEKIFENGFKILDKKKYGKSFLIYIIKN